MLEDKQQKVKWYFKTTWIVTIFLCVGPLVLPLIWLNPRFSRIKKIVITAIILIASYYAAVWFIDALSSIKKYYGVIFEGNF
ncbi:MAG: hypothetical protein PHG69_03045 [Candidatus Omnitrophica bacterium]|nr:hypothetical protein [Candidatus Omnitrophota bacterium]